ncbi:hypothetical protein [Urbifossiella limnaea]|uniref:Uncharacterized protein n=1 Tax=Urbifossiella limnaea TaxID=2528023 RepID=A0A517XLJ8_9BACT|nr:hypothetical protein [Urbifossiella limnaea]QDU18385.1 hypothetical protein ETAA1_02710 [Urbifossiella limnaea]
MTDPAARAALLARLPALGFVPPPDVAPWARPRPVGKPPRSWAGVERVPPWEPTADPAAVSAAVAAFRTALAANEAAAVRERRGRWLERVAGRLFVLPMTALIVLGGVAVVFIMVCGCLGGLVR